MQLPDAPRPGEPIRADTIARILAWLKRPKIKAVAPLRAIESGGLTTLFFDGGTGDGGGALVPAKTGAGGIAAVSGSTLGSADVTLYDLTESEISLSSRTEAAKNPYPTAIGANKFVWLTRRSNGVLYVVTEAC